MIQPERRHERERGAKELEKQRKIESPFFAPPRLRSPPWCSPSSTGHPSCAHRSHSLCPPIVLIVEEHGSHERHGAKGVRHIINRQDIALSRLPAAFSATEERRTRRICIVCPSLWCSPRLSLLALSRATKGGGQWNKRSVNKQTIAWLSSHFSSRLSAPL